MSNTPNVNIGTDAASLFADAESYESSANTYFNKNDNLSARYSPYLSQESLKASFSNIIPLESVISELLSTRVSIKKVVREIDDFLKQVYVDQSKSPTLESAHTQVWNEVINKANTVIGEEIEIAKENPANYISYQEYTYAKEHKCRGCRVLTMEYEAYVGKTVLSYYYDIKLFLSFFLHELQCMYEFTINTIGEQYNDETEKTIAKEFYFWSKSLNEYTKLFAKEITSLPPRISQSQMDYVSKIQATQFEAFFSFKINSYESELKKLLGSVKKEMVDTCDMYYQNFLAPALKSRSYISYPLEIDLLSSNIKNKAPDLAQEIVIAASSINGNLASLLADLKQKRANTQRRIDGFIETIRLKRKYISFSNQLEMVSGIRSQPTFIDVDYDKYATQFEEAVSFHEKNETLNSSHKYFNDLLEDNHPQYLLRSGGVVTGDIQLKEGIKIGGIDFVNHSHGSSDGSQAIKISSIDYQTDRDNQTGLINFYRSDQEPISINVDSFIQDILVGGVPVIDVLTSTSINSDNEEPGRYDIIVSYIELEG
jgi:hypothetical protein